MTRRAILLVVLAVPLLADDAQQVWDILTDLSSALSEGNSVEFMHSFDRSMAGYETLRANVTALLEQAQVVSSVEIVSEEGDGQARTVELDWFLQIANEQDGAVTVRRRERVRCRLQKEKKNWRVVGLEPLSLFAPPKPAR